MKPLQILLLTGAAVVVGAGGATAAQKTYREHFAQPTLSRLSLSTATCLDDGKGGGTCDGVIELFAPPASLEDARETGGGREWMERRRWDAAQVTAFIAASCVLDDGARPRAFVASEAACPAPTAPDGGPDG